ncbi:MAG: hypothetical protein IPH04_19640 [Saprospirales bacterium]|nr:hypothetical protein [Saprospirales bacterium]
MASHPKAGALLVLVVTSLMAISFDFQQNPTHPLLESSGVEVSAKNPFEVGFDLQKNEKISLSLTRLQGDAVLTDLKVIVFQAGAAQQVKSWSQFPNPFIAPQEGAYKFKLDLSNSKKSMVINLAVLSDQKPPEKEATPKDTTSVSAVFIGNKQKKNMPQPMLQVDAKRGQYLTAKTNLKDDKLPYIKYEYSGDGQTYYLADQTPHLVERDGKASFRFFLDKPKNPGLNFQDFLTKNNGILLDNLQIHRYKPSSGTPAPIAKEEDDDNMDALIKAMDAQAKAMAAKGQQDSLRLDALIKQGIDTFASPLYTMEEPFLEVIPPQANIVAEKSNRPCYPINNLLLNSPLFFAYSILLGEDAQERYEKTQINFRNRAAANPNAGFVGSLLHSYSGQLIQGLQYVPTKGFFSPMSQSKTKEFVDYAIVDRDNMMRFQRGDIYTAYFPGLEGSAISHDYGNAPVPTDPANYELFLCFCNKNFLSPVNVFFTFETFTVNVTNPNPQ